MNRIPVNNQLLSCVIAKSGTLIGHLRASITALIIFVILIAVAGYSAS